MNAHVRMKALAESPEAVRTLARALLRLADTDPDVAWTDWELDFLESMAERAGTEPLSMRQREVLSELRSAAERHLQVDGFKVRTLVERCWLEREYLDDDDDQRFIEDLRTSDRQSVTRRQLGRLLGCCRALGVLEMHQGLER